MLILFIIYNDFYLWGEYVERLLRSAFGEKWKDFRLVWFLVDCGLMILKVFLFLVVFFKDRYDFIFVYSWLKFFFSLDLVFRCLMYKNILGIKMIEFMSFV